MSDHDRFLILVEALSRISSLSASTMADAKVIADTALDRAAVSRWTGE